MKVPSLRLTSGLSLTLLLALVMNDYACGQSDWKQQAGNQQRNGRTTVIGPDAPTLLWENDDDPAGYGSLALICGDRVLNVRSSPGSSTTDPLICYDLETGSEIWRTIAPGSDNVHALFLLGISSGNVYVTRGQLSNPSRILAYRISDGALAWQSDLIYAGNYSEFIRFAPDGDPIITDYDYIARMDSGDGSTVWTVNRNGPYNDGAGTAVFGNSMIVMDRSQTGSHLFAPHKFNLLSGVFEYSGPQLYDDSQNSPLISPDGSTVYMFHNTTGDVSSRFTAYEDTGLTFVEKWHLITERHAFQSIALAADGSPYMLLENRELVRLDPDTGEITATAGVLSPFPQNSLHPMMSVDGAGKLYLSNQREKLWVFSSDLQTLHFELATDGVGYGAPTIGGDGILVVSDKRSVRAYREETIVTTFSPTFLDIGGGDITNGSVFDLEFSDNVDVSAERAPFSIRPLVTMTLGTHSTLLNPAVMQFRFEGSVFSRPNVVQNILLYDFVGEEFVPADTRLASKFFDSTAVVTAPGDASRFVQQSSGYMEVKIEFVPPNARAAFGLNIDWAQWQITE